MAEQRQETQVPVLSVVIPCLNEEHRLPLCLGALRAQTFPAHRFETIVVDNGSTDHSLEAVRSFPEVRLLQETRRDPYLARNTGIEASAGSYIVLLDADCIAESCWLEELSAEMDRSVPEIILGYLAYPAGASRLVRRQERHYHTKLDYLITHKLSDYYFGHAGNMAVRRDVFLELGLFPPMPVAGDTEIIHRLLEHRPSARITYVPSARVVHDEVLSFADYLSKVREYGGHMEACMGVNRSRPLPLREKLRIFRDTIAEEKYEVIAAIETASSLLAGLVSFERGRAQARRRQPPAHTA